MRYKSFIQQSELIKLRLSTIDKDVTTITLVNPLTDQHSQKRKFHSSAALTKYKEFEKLLNQRFGPTPLPDDIDQKKLLSYKMQYLICMFQLKVSSILSSLVRTMLLHKRPLPPPRVRQLIFLA